MTTADDMKVLKEIFATVDAIGVDETLKALRVARVKLNPDMPQIDLLINLICANSDISPDDMRDNRNHDNKRLAALWACAYFLHIHMKLRVAMIARKIGKSPSRVSIYITNATNALREKRKSDTQLMFVSLHNSIKDSLPNNN